MHQHAFIRKASVSTPCAASASFRLIAVMSVADNSNTERCNTRFNTYIALA